MNALRAARAALAAAAAEVERLTALEGPLEAPPGCPACGRDCGHDAQGRLHLHVPLGVVVPAWPAPIEPCPGSGARAPGTEPA